MAGDAVRGGVWLVSVSLPKELTDTRVPIADLSAVVPTDEISPPFLTNLSPSLIPAP